MHIIHDYLARRKEEYFHLAEALIYHKAPSKSFHEHISVLTFSQAALQPDRNAERRENDDNDQITKVLFLTQSKPV